MFPVACYWKLDGRKQCSTRIIQYFTRDVTPTSVTTKLAVTFQITIINIAYITFATQ